MKIGSKVKVIASLAKDGEGIQHLMGNIYTVTCHYKQKNMSDYEVENKIVYVDCKEFGGSIALVKGEYEELK